MEINFDNTTKMLNGYPKITKLGATTPNDETSPFVFNGRLYRLELYDPSTGTDINVPHYAIIRDRESGEIVSSFGEGCYYYSYYGEGNKVYVLGTKSGATKYSGDTIMLFESDDLIHWTSRELFSQKGFNFFNTSLAKGDDEYVLLLEANEPKNLVGHAFTFFFASSKDMLHWEMMDPEKTAFSTERYNGGPWMHYCNGYYYVLSVTALPCFRFSNYLFRTKDFMTWEVGYYNPILMPSEEDRKLSDKNVDFTPELIEELRTGFISNNSDIDMCTMPDGRTLMTYNAGNQLGFAVMCEAIYDGTVEEFLEANFR